MQSVKRFWEFIDAAWSQLPKHAALRTKVIESEEAPEAEVWALAEVVKEEVASTLRAQLFLLSRAELTKFIHRMEQKLYELDREEIFEHTGGTDDSFLYCRCFIVGMGKAYFDKIKRRPHLATYEASAEAIGFEGYHVYEERFGEEFNRYSTHSIESGSNVAGWPLPDSNAESSPNPVAPTGNGLSSVQLTEEGILIQYGWDDTEYCLRWSELEEIQLLYAGKAMAEHTRWFLINSSSQQAHSIPHQPEVLARFAQLPGFDLPAVNAVFASAQFGIVECWRRNRG